MEGVMMRNGDIYGLAVRKANGEICAQRLPWRSYSRSALLNLPFLRGFPVLLETLVNGIQALNRSTAMADDADCAMSPAGAIFSLGIALVVAIGLFVLAPHLLSLLMLGLRLGGDVEGLSFHIWDGLFKAAIFIAYIRLISLVPDIHRVFQYHGAEHKTIHAWEQRETVDSAQAMRMSRLHPRCGTTFLLFVIAISIALQAIAVPLFLKALAPQEMLAKHITSLGIKLALVAPISAAAYEMIRFAAGLPAGVAATALQAPGLWLQRLTTREPDAGQIDVALVALAESLDHEDASRIRTAPYNRVETDIAMFEMI